MMDKKKSFLILFRLFIFIFFSSAECHASPLLSAKTFFRPLKTKKEKKFPGVKVPKKDSTPPFDLDTLCQNFVLGTKQIKLSQYPEAFNPSIVRWNGSYLMSFRIIDPDNIVISRIGLVWLDEQFLPRGEPQILETRKKNSKLVPKSEDARLCTVDNRLYIIYNDNEDQNSNDGGIRRMYFSELYFDGESFELVDIQQLDNFDFENKKISEKNWVPFEYNGTLLFAYSLMPHCILWPLEGSGRCQTVETTTSVFDWEWGVLRGGTQAVLVDNEYLGFFHSCNKLASVQSQGKEIYFYYMGAYTYKATPPFFITRMSPEPIVHTSFYNGKGYCNGSHLEKKVIFPGGFVVQKDFIWVIYGRDDVEIWIAKLDKTKLYQSLIPVSSKQL
jgi:predicted GH43/DUF377 family glycosyl hydrolase